MTTTVDVLKACVENHVGVGPLPTERYDDAEPVLEALLKIGLIDYGVSLRTAFVTGSGVAYLRLNAPDWSNRPAVLEHLAEHEGYHNP